ncbi:MAG: hypothetical protein H0T89_32590 [Deltaproteobacteria bacterium]|nr:hypothetical protein [Deltaproteobacteria bacterium]MDQ3299024.1 hypothetical protein [Myxococcota bacterium]
MRNSALVFAFASTLVWNVGIRDSDAAPKKKGAAAGGKAGPACGAKVLPLVVGNSWTYHQAPAPAALPENLARLAPAQPKQIVVSVTAIENKGGDTHVTLEEKHTFDLSRDPKEPKLAEHVVKATIVCNEKGKFDISPEAFYFAGEPGGFYGLTFDKFDRKKETSLKLTKGAIGENEWIEEISAHFTRQATKGEAKLSGGKLELERKFIPQQLESVVTKLGSYKAEKLAVTTTGRVVLDDRLAPNGKPCSGKAIDPATKAETVVPTEICELPANWINQLWLVEGVGVVQALNSYAHMYQLVESNVK